MCNPNTYGSRAVYECVKEREGVCYKSILQILSFDVLAAQTKAAKKAKAKAKPQAKKRASECADGSNESKKAKPAEADVPEGALPVPEGEILKKKHGGLHQNGN